MKSLSQNFALIACFALAAAACSSGDDDKGYGSRIGGPAEEQAAARTIDSIYDLRSFKDSGGSDDLALASVTVGFSEASTLLNAKLGSQQGQGTQYLMATDELKSRIAALSPSIAVANGGDERASALGDDCVSVSGDTITYNNCSWVYGSIDGWITTSGDHLSFDLEVAYVDGDYYLDLDMKGDIVASDTQFLGDFSYNIEARFGEVTLSYKLDGEFDVVITDGCATGGYLEIHGDIVASSAGNSANWNGWVRAEFGPTCGAVRLY